MKRCFQVLVPSLACVLLAVAGCAAPAPQAPAATSPTSAPESKAAPAGAAPAAPAAASSATIAVGFDAECWNPIEGPCGRSLGYHDLVMDRLLTFDKDMKLAHGLASSWEIVNDLTWEFKLRQGVTFTNGEPFNAQAVVFMFDAVLNPQGRDAPPSTIGRYALLKQIEVVDDYTVRFITKEPFPVLGNYLAFEPRAVPPKYYAQLGKDEFGKKPIGTGPYRLVEWIPNDHFSLEANPNYWGKTPGIKQLKFRPIPTEGTRMAELLAGTTDIVTDVPADSVSAIDQSSKVHKVAVPSFRSVYINFRPEDRLQNQQLREAFFYATDIDLIIKTVLGGNADKTGRGNSLTPYEFGYNPNIPDWPYDPAKAVESLKASGYDGRELKMFYGEGDMPSIDQLSAALQAQWAKVGLNVAIHKQEFGLWRTNWTARTIDGDFYLTSGGATAMDSDARLIPEVHCYAPERGMGRVSFFCNPEIDTLMEQARAVVDPEKRKALYAEAWAKHRDAAHVMALYAPRYIYGLSNRISWQPSSGEDVWSKIVDATIK